MSNKKLILGIAAGAVVLKRKGYLDGIIEKAEGYGEEIADKYKNVKETARKKYDEVIQKGGEIADKIKSSHEGQAVTETTDSAATV